jgi:hypothetical protein
MNRPSKIALLALAIAPLCATAAQAETIYLQCGQDSFTVDLDNKTVNGAPAEISPTQITWTRTDIIPGPPGWSQTLFYELDRVSGSVSWYGVMTEPSGQKRRANNTATLQCERAQAPATKF